MSFAQTMEVSNKLEGSLKLKGGTPKSTLDHLFAMKKSLKHNDLNYLHVNPLCVI